MTDQGPHDPEQSRAPEPGRTSTEEPERRGSGRIWILLLIAVGVMLVWSWQRSSSELGVNIDYSVFRDELEIFNIREVHFTGEVLTGEFRFPPQDPPDSFSADKLRFNTVLPPVPDEKLLEDLRRSPTDAQVELAMRQAFEEDPDELGRRMKLIGQLTSTVKVTAAKTSIGLGTQLAVWLLIPLLFLGGFWFLMRRNADPLGGGGMIGKFARSPARKFEPSERQTTFEDVAALEQAKGELEEVVEFLKSPERFRRLGAEIPKGVLLKGPPGTGKTLLSRATAGEAGVPFYSINGSEFIQMFVGVGASRVRDLFRTAREHSPCILFIDEIDAVGRMRGAGLGGGHDEREQTLNQILSEMDGFDDSSSVIVLAATNRPDVLDSALLRPGRFDRHITVDRPPREGRLAILKVHCRKVPLADDVDFQSLAGATVGFSGAGLKNLVNEAALSAARADRSRVMREDFEYAHDRVLIGPKREEILNDDERERTAFHEAGHALLAWMLPEVDPVHKVTIIPRGPALGVTQLLPEEDLYHVGESRLHAQLVMLLGGRSAEKIVFDEFGAGAEDDLTRATSMARRMVGHWGMSETVGPVAFHFGGDHPFLGKELQDQREFSEETAHVIDMEVRQFLETASQRAGDLLVENRRQLDDIAQALLEREELTRDDLRELLGEPVPRCSRRRSES